MVIQNKKEYLTVNEMASLCNVSIATLKHYERKGLIKPDRVDERTLYRYYSIYQYERIETIRELRELGIPIATIKEYLTDRNVNKSLLILKDRYETVKTDIKELLELRHSIRKQIQLLENCSNIGNFPIRLEHFEQREIVLYEGEDIEDLQNRSEKDFNYAILTLEMSSGRNNVAATLGRGRLGLYIPLDELAENHLTTSYPFILLDEHSRDIPNKIVLPENDYICIMHRGESRNRVPYLQQLMAYANANGYEFIGDVIQLSLIDDTVSDNFDEYVFDIQAPVRKKVED